VRTEGPLAKTSQLKVAAALGSLALVVACESGSPEDLDQFLQSQPQAATATDASLVFTPSKVEFGTVKASGTPAGQTVTIAKK
jgi:hypothetical protein